ncbi:MAG: PAS domain S-box protein [bacterium]|nr:PAS domain S-box protein [bacterium]
MKAGSRRQTVLLLDPDGASEAVLLRALEGTDTAIRRALSLEEAGRLAGELRPELIVAEFDPDSAEGLRLFRMILEDREYRDRFPVPFVMISDPPTRERHAEELFPLGLMGWIVRPLDPATVREVFHNWLWLHEAFRKAQRLKQEVRKSEVRYRDLLENASDFIFTLDSEGRFLYLNNRFKSLTGFEKEEWLGRPFPDLFEAEDRKTAREHYEQTHQGRSRVFEAHVLHKTTAPNVLSISLTPIVEVASVTGTMGIGRDILEQKRMEREILDLENFNASIIESMEAGLLTVDLDGIITSLNTGGQNILERVSEEVLGRPIGEVLPPAEAEALLSPGSADDGLPSRREMELTLKSGRKAAIGYTVTDRVDNQRRKVGTIVSFRDITLIKQMQNEVIRMDRLASLGVLASGIAHEIKNPLAGIKSLAQACEEEFEGEDPRREYLARIIRQVNRMDDLLRTFFAYAKPKPPDRKPVPLSDIIREVGHLMNRKMDKAGIRYSVELADVLPPVVVDGPQIQQVFLNLMLNAVDAMPGGGTLAIRAAVAGPDFRGLMRRRTPDPRPDPSRKGASYVEIRICDSGTGIPEDKLETIFDPFFTTKPGGLGLGLSIVYRIIAEHQGDIRVKSRPDHGTEFSIYLPTGDPS